MSIKSRSRLVLRLFIFQCSNSFHASTSPINFHNFNKNRTFSRLKKRVWHTFLSNSIKDHSQPPKKKQMLNEGILDFAVNNQPCKFLTLCGAKAPSNPGGLDVPQHVTIDGEQWTVTKVAPRSFVNCKWLTSVSLPDSITEIGRQAFANCTSLAKAVLPSRLTVINAMTFANCTSLTSIHLADSITEICEGAFTGCSSLSDIILPSSIKSIRKDAFSYCTKLTTINLPDGVQNVDAKAFYDTGLSSVSVPPSVSHIGVLASCFFLREFKVDALNTKFCDIDGVLFNATKKILIRYPAARTASTYVIPDGTRIIGTGAFCRCHSIETLVIPASVNYVSDNAFLQSSIKRIINNAPTPQYVGKNAFRQLPPDVTLEITEPEALSAFAASKWNRIMPPAATE